MHGATSRDLSAATIKALAEHRLLRGAFLATNTPQPSARGAAGCVPARGARPHERFSADLAPLYGRENPARRHDDRAGATRVGQSSPREPASTLGPPLTPTLSAYFG